jgi:hypothetical protein
MVYVEDEEIQEMTATSSSRPLILDGTVNLDYIEEVPVSGFYALISWLRRHFFSS